MDAIIAAGGTAGHINPALSIAGEILKNEPDSRILFVGRIDGMESKLVVAAGYQLREIEMHGFNRSLKPRDILENIQTVFCVFRAGKQAAALFDEFKPDIVIGCGGYISGPIVRKASRMGIKTAIQEQNAAPGLTTKLLARNVDLFMAASSDVLGRIKTGRARRVVTGNPVNERFFSADRDVVRSNWGIGDRVCVVSVGGSLGASTMNNLMSEFIRLHAGTGGIYHIHATGQYGTVSFPKLLEQKGVDPSGRDLRIVEYIDNMPDCFAAADLVISRAGAITVSEIAAAGRAAVLIPSPNVSENHQLYNARTLQSAGAAMIFEEKDMDMAQVAEKIYRLCLDRERLRIMGTNAKSVAVDNSTELIYRSIRDLVDDR